MGSITINDVVTVRRCGVSLGGYGGSVDALAWYERGDCDVTLCAPDDVETQPFHKVCESIGVDVSDARVMARFDDSG